MRRFAIAAAALMLVPTLVRAQAPRRPAAAGMIQDAPSLAELLVTNRAFLQLDDDQVARLREVAAGQRANREELNARLGALREVDRSEITQEQRTEMRAAMMTARQSAMQGNRQLRSILTVEQMGRVGRLGGMLQSAARGSRTGMLRGQRGPQSQPGMRRGSGFRPRQPGMRGGAGPRPPAVRRGTGMAPRQPGSAGMPDVPAVEQTSWRAR